MSDLTSEVKDEKRAVLEDLIERFNSAVSVFEYEDLKSEFEELGDGFIPDAKKYANECAKKIKSINEEKKNIDYQLAISTLNKAKSAKECDELKEYFDELGDYKSAKYYSGLCLKIKDEIITTESYKNQAVRIENKNYSYQSKTATAPVRKSNTVRTKKNLKEISENAKTATLITVLIFRVPCLLCGFLMIIIFGIDATDMYAVTMIMILIIGMILDVIKIGYCFFTFSEAGTVFEEKAFLLGAVNSIENSFLQTCVRLTVHAAITILYFIIACAVMIVTIFAGI